jgi:hypothetical protein
MSIGIFGTKKMADVSVNDVDILYAFNPDRETIGDTTFQPLFSTISDADLKKMLGADGVYKLRLPADKFNQLGFYSIIIKPKTIETVIQDCSYIISSDNSSINISKKGIVIPAAQFQQAGSIIGFQIEYFDSNNVKINNLHRIVTSSDLVSISTNNNTVNQGANSYVLDQGGTNLFLTVTPDEPSLISSSASVNIGTRGQTILVSNTYFDPVTIEVEMTDMTLKTLGFGIFGNSTRDLETNILSYFDDQNRIYRQYNLYTTKKLFGNGNIDIREQRSIINLNQDFASTVQGLTTN